MPQRCNTSNNNPPFVSRPSASWQTGCRVTAGGSPEHYVALCGTLVRCPGVFDMLGELNIICGPAIAVERALFSVLHFGVLGWSLYEAKRAPVLLRVLLCLHAAASVTPLAILGGMCASTSVPAAIHARVPVLATQLGIRLFQWISSTLVTCAFATHFAVCKSDGRVRILKLAVLGTLVLATAAAVFWLGWRESGDHDPTELHRSARVLALFGASNFLCLYSDTRSRVVAFNIFVLVPAIIVAWGLMNTLAPIDHEGRQVIADDRPAKILRAEDIPTMLRALLMDLRGFGAYYACGHAVVVSHPRPSGDSRPFAADLSRLDLRVHMWLVLPLLAGLVERARAQSRSCARSQ